MDPQQKGYIDFASFQSRFGPQMSKQVSVEENELHSQNLVPNQAKLEEYGEKTKAVAQAISDVTRVFRPD